MLETVLYHVPFLHNIVSKTYTVSCLGSDMSKLLIKLLFLLSLHWHASAIAQIPQIKPCYAKDLMEPMPLPPDTEIIQVSGHKFRKKDPCIPFDVTMSWKEHFNNAPYAQWDLNYTQVFSGELWYKKDIEEIAFAANPINWAGSDRITSFSASGSFCKSMRGDTCNEMTMFGSSHAIPTKLGTLSAGGSIEYAFPKLPNIVDEIFVLGRVDYEFKKGEDYARPGMTWINNLTLNPFKYVAIREAIENRKVYDVVINYNKNNDLEDVYSYSNGQVKLKFNFNPRCPYKLKIVTPTKKLFVFSKENPGRLTINAEINTDFPEEHVDKIRWIIPQKNGSNLSITPNNRTGRNIEFTYSGLPKSNNDFGDTKIMAKAYIGSICGELNDSKNIQLFFDRDATNNISGTEPNWYYYWQQTNAGHGTQQTSDIRYHAREEGCANPDWLAYHPIDKIGTPSDYIEKGRSYIFLCDFHKYDNRYPGMPNTNFLMTAITTPGKVWQGIDTFGVIVKHELKHRENMNIWWPNGWPSVGWFDANNNGTQDPNEMLTTDMDHDYIPDQKEQGMGYDKTKRKTHFLQFPQDFMWDEHHYVYKFAENGWTIGSADTQDWAKPGKQWFD
jgi:hypothetical protein